MKRRWQTKTFGRRSDSPDGRLWDGVWARWYLHSFLPLLLPGVCQQVAVLWGDVVGVRQLHCTDQVFPEHLWGRETHTGSQTPS